LESIYNLHSGKFTDHLGKLTKTDHKYRKPEHGVETGMW